MMREKGVDDAILGGKGPRVRLGRPLSRRGAAGFEGYDRELPLARDTRGLGQVMGIGNALEIEEEKLDLRIGGDGASQLGDRHVGIVPGRVRMAHADAAAAQEAVGDDAHGAALAAHGDRAVRGLLLDEHGREAQDGAGAEVRQALRVRPDEAHAVGARHLDHKALLGTSLFRRGLAEAGGHDDRHLYPAARAVLDGGHRGIAG